MENIFHREFIDQSLFRIRENTKKIEACINLLDEREVWFRPNEQLNSVGNLMLHLCGNIMQYIISSLGQMPDVRERDREFSISGGYKNAELFGKFHDTVEIAQTIIANAGPENLLRKRIVQGTVYSGIGIVIHVTEHYSYHAGQVIFLTKLLKNVDMGFYSGIDLNKRNGSETEE